MMKEEIKTVKKVWGKEVIIVNREEYCGKLLLVDSGAQSSYHYHRRKIETFYALKGTIALTIDKKDYMLTPFSRPKTIMPNQLHMFTSLGVIDAVILEISTHHNEKDVIRETESKCSPTKKL